MPQDYRYAIGFRVILDFLSFEDLPAMFTSCVEVRGALKNYTGFVMERWQFGKKAKHIMKKDVFEWYVARLGRTGTFSVLIERFNVGRKEIWACPGYNHGVFEVCLWHDNVPFLEMLLQECPSPSMKHDVVDCLNNR
jgi:hypothetical protein